MSALGPHHSGGTRAANVWNRRMRWLRRRSLDVTTAIGAVDFVALRNRVTRLERDRLRRLPRGDRPWKDPDAVRSPTFNDHLLEVYFGWLTEIGSTEEEVVLLNDFWRYAAVRQKAKARDEREFAYPEQFERRVIERLAVLAMTRTDGEPLWKAVFALGPKGHHSISILVSHWFFKIEEFDPDRFVAVWRAAASHALASPAWEGDGLWYYREDIFRRLMGFDLSSFLAKLDNVDRRISEMAPLYETWAKNHLAGNGDNVAAFCRFLSSQAGVALRREGLHWIAEAIRSERGLGYWSRHENIAEAVVELVTEALISSREALRKDAGLREALLQIVGELMKRQVPAGLVLQERVKILQGDRS